VEGQYYVPLQVASDIIPRVSEHLFYDAALAELRSLAVVAQKGEPSSSAGPSSSDASASRISDRSAVVGNSGSAGSSAVPVKRSGRLLRRDGKPYLVVIDAGHGGPDNGMSGPIGARNKIYEKDITLAVSRKIVAVLKERGVDVLMTRNRDTLIALADRGRIAVRAQANMFVSVHVNAANMGWDNPRAARGFETYFLAEAKTEDARRVEQMENDAVKFELEANESNSDALSFILKDMVQNESHRESRELAELVQGELAEMHPGPSRGVKQANFAVLRGSYTMPAVLVEIGFGTNPQEAAYISDQRRQQDLAAAIARSVITYLERFEQRVGKAQ
jgi:N-acetylmuramoyl-L-alanine amidase